MSELYLTDCYLREFNSIVEKVSEERFIVLEDTAFYPTAGGQLTDTGMLVADGTEYMVANCMKKDGKIVHEVDKEGLLPGMAVYGFIDWDRRYRLMRAHTAAHILSEIIRQKTGALITGNQLGLERSRIDFNLEKYDKETLFSYVDEANEIICRGLPIEIYTLARKEAVQHEEFFGLKNVLPPDVKELRIIDIKGFSRDACGGTHVKNTSEIGGIEILKVDNKGKNNRRLYFGLK